jgi:hypothetical protein
MSSSSSSSLSLPASSELASANVASEALDDIVVVVGVDDVAGRGGGGGVCASGGEGCACALRVVVGVVCTGLSAGSGGGGGSTNAADIDDDRCLAVIVVVVVGVCVVVVASDVGGIVVVVVLWFERKIGYWNSATGRVKGKAKKNPQLLQSQIGLAQRQRARRFANADDDDVIGVRRLGCAVGLCCRRRCLVLVLLQLAVRLRRDAVARTASAVAAARSENDVPRYDLFGWLVGRFCLLRAHGVVR